ncbi:hypothetical protein D3C87_935100 [compost metagenome]
MNLAQFFKETPAEELKVLVEFVKPSNMFGGIEVPEVEQWRFCDVMEFRNMELIDAVFGIIGKHTAMMGEEILQEPANEFMSFLKFVDMQFKKAVAYLDMLKTEPDADKIAAGIEELDKFGEYNIYRSIDPNPLNWDAISEITFDKMFTKLLMEKDYAQVQKNLDKIMHDRMKSKV